MTSHDVDITSWVTERRPSWICFKQKKEKKPFLFRLWIWEHYNWQTKSTNVQSLGWTPAFMAGSPTNVTSENDVTPVGEEKLDFDDNTLRGEKMRWIVFGYLLSTYRMYFDSCNNPHPLIPFPRSPAGCVNITSSKPHWYTSVISPPIPHPIQTLTKLLKSRAYNQIFRDRSNIQAF